MLADTDAIATIAVKDLNVAKKFYEGTLGLKTKTPEQETEALEYKSGKSRLFVYRSQYAGTNKATAVNWVVDDIDDVVRTLKAKGVAFEHYEMPGLTLKGDIHVSGKMKIAWFKDPDGNILALMNG
jgi:catechol 2,3-dioxygenase-like lactoylglutathione lyase family enzyme